MTNKILTLEEVKKRGLYCWSYDNGDYEYTTEGSPHIHLIRHGVDLLKDKKAIDCNSYDNGDYVYQTEDEEWHYIENEVSND